MTLLIMAICTVLFEKLETILRSNSFFQIVHNNEILGIFKNNNCCLKTTVELTFTT